MAPGREKEPCALSTSCPGEERGLNHPPSRVEADPGWAYDS
jgi:hypothetical protein